MGARGIELKHKSRFLPAAALFLLSAACGQEDNTARDQSEAAGIIPHQVTYDRERTRIEAVGTARARASALIYPETGGEVAEVLFRAGDFVEKGDPLLKLDSREEELAVRLARVAVTDAEQLLARYRRIEDTGAVSDSQIDEARTALDAAQIELEQAELALSQRTVVAPFQGYVGLSDIDPGARITSTTQITQLDDRRILFVDFDAPEQVFGRIATGDMVAAAPFAGEETSVEAKVAGIDSRVDPTSRSFVIRTEIDNGDDALRPGMSFRVNFDIAGNALPSVPEASIIWGSEGAYVWKVEDGVARRVSVSIVARREGLVLVDADLPENSIIVAEGVQKVREGAAVRFVNGALLDEAENGGGDGPVGAEGSR